MKAEELVEQYAFRTVSCKWTMGDAPARVGFYWTLTAESPDAPVALAWDRMPGSGEKQWLAYVSPDPTASKVPVPAGQVTVLAFAAMGAAHKKAFLTRELTEPERIQQAYDRMSQEKSLYESGSSPEHLKLREIPECRRLAVGDAVEIGNLADCVVVGIFDEGRTVVARHTRLKSREEARKNPAPSVDYGAWPWESVLKKEWARPESVVQPPRLYGSVSNNSLESLIFEVRRTGMRLRPEYQRGYVWNDKDKERFLESVFCSRELGRFAIVKRPYPHADEILDGQQRLTTLIDFVCSRLSFRGIWWHQLCRIDRHQLLSQSVPVVRIDAERYSRAEILEMFVELNAAGVPQTEEHLAKVREMIEEARKASPDAVPMDTER